jgi:GT2 family glycosyltransferase/glycosyltransferase involved in cell wall biosynthesis
MDSLMAPMAGVLMISYSGSLGGAERALVEFATALDGERCLACPPGDFAELARASRIRVLELPVRALDLRASPADRLRALGRLAGHARETRALARDLDPDLVIVSGMRSTLALLLGPRRPAPAVPIVVDHHDMVPGPLIGRLVRRAAARAALVVVPSQAVAHDLQLQSGVEVVAPGIDVSRFEREHRPELPPTVLVLGALVSWKRPDLALEAVAVARRRWPELHVRLVGAPIGGGRRGRRFVEQLHERAGDPDLAGVVEFTGAVEDSAPELARAVCLLHGAPREPFGLVIAEALAAGCPVIAPEAAGPREIVDESCALLYPPADIDAAAGALVTVLEQAERVGALAAAGRAVARARFDRSAARERFVAAVAPVARPARPALPARSARSAGRARLALVTVTHNSAGKLEALLASVGRHLPGVRVVVVDNASADETLAVARQRRDDVEVDLIMHERNLGFGAACNEGVRAANEAVTAIVNPDVELLDDSLLLLADALSQHDRLLAPLVLSADGSRQDTVHPTPTSSADLVRALVPPALVPGRGGVALAPWRSLEPRRVGWAVACALVARTQTLLALGPFDEQIFLYGEDLDLGLRAAAAGVETWFWPRARVLHHGAHATAPAFGGEPFELLARARHEVVRRRLGRWRGGLDDLAQATTFGSRIALKRAFGRPVARERSQLAAVASVRR